MRAVPGSSPLPYLPHLLFLVVQKADALYAQEIEVGILTPVQFTVLDAIQRLNKPSGSDIIRSTRIDRSTLSDVLIRMAKRGLISKRLRKGDLRSHVLTLTAAGFEALKQSQPAVGSAVKRLVSTLSPAERKAFLDGIQRIANAGQVPLKE